MDYRYKAFISYRHNDRDTAVAKAIQQGLERFHIPASIREKYGMERIGRVFRDQEELPLSADLGKDIETALDHSDYLICICTPRYLECSLFKISRAIKSFSGLWFALGSSLTS